MSIEKKLLTANALGAFAVLSISIIAFLFQLSDHEIPCPLCLLQRAGFLLIAFGLVMNLRFGLKANHYMLAFLGAIFTILSSFRQVLLHIIPGTGTYGGAIFSWHLYTWSLVTSFLFLCAICVSLWAHSYIKHPGKINLSKISGAAFYALAIALFILCLSNAISSYMECGFHYCPSDPTSYPHTLFW